MSTSKAAGKCPFKATTKKGGGATFFVFFNEYATNDSLSELLINECVFNLYFTKKISLAFVPGTPPPPPIPRVDGGNRNGCVKDILWRVLSTKKWAFEDIEDAAKL